MQKQVVQIDLVLLLILALADAGCSYSQMTASPPSEFEAYTDDRTTLEGNSGIRIPSSATGVTGYTTGVRELDTYLRFQIPASDLEGFLLNIGCTTPLSKADIRRQLEGAPDRSWWAPEKAQSYGSCNASTDHDVQLVFIDMTDPQNYIVYVAASTY